MSMPNRDSKTEMGSLVQLLLIDYSIAKSDETAKFECTDRQNQRHGWIETAL